MYTSDEDFKDYIAELKAPWKTMDSDLDTALAIISQHQQGRAFDDLELLSVSEQHDGAEISFPNWQSQIEKTFIEQYGLNQGKAIFKKVVMRLFLLSRGRAQSLH